ncbi:hypothetical protein JQC91_12630 [Jannaschia sp. Os4]|uniref:hypothetical protein n=1 Tax=Jannaschia sp. Os4 TaxID=2807617 RepID=UPI001939531B|nr:hypothetical protein [Jannaschia sp. Os4]MBM2577146.1 hypothetical protein [Jannaschia sp. Os4]
MNRIATLATVAMLALPGAASAQSMGQGFDMLTSALVNDFTRMGISLGLLDDVTLGELAAVRNVLNSSESDNQKKGQIEAILAD